MDDYRSNKAIRFLRWFCRPEFLDEIEGDIIELYELRQIQQPGKAHRLLWWDVLKSFRWINIKHVKTQNNTATMFKNYFKVGLRNLIRDFRFSIINLLGLSIGMSIFLLMIMMIQHEFSFDTFHTKSDRIYQVIQEFQQSDGADPEIWTPRPLSDALQAEVAGISQAISMQGAASNWVEIEGTRFFEEEGIIAGSNFLDIFDFKLLAGESSMALKSKRSTIISESLSKKYFGFDNPIGKTIHHDFYGPFTVTGVMEDVPSNSYLQFNYILTQDLQTYFEHAAPWYERWYGSWRGHSVSTFVLLDEGIDTENITSQIQQLVAQNQQLEHINNFYLLGMTDLHFGSNGIDGRINQHIKGDRNKVYIFSIIAAVIMLMACFNYINITTARSIKRHKEVGIRKSIGAFRSQVMTQFLIESFSLVIVSLGFSLLLSHFLIPIFNEVVGLNLTFSWELVSEIFPWVIASALLITVLSGFYPAIILSGTSALVLVKNMNLQGKQGNWLRNGLVTLQFAIVIILAACLVIINDQYQFMSNKSLGLSTEEIIVLEINSGPVRNNYTTLKAELKRHPGVQEVTGITRVFSGYRSPVSVIGNHSDNPEQEVPLKFYGVDQEAIEVFGLELLAGEGFQGISGLDSTSVILNETAAKAFGGYNIVGSWVDLEEDQGDHGATLKARVIGIVKDFHFESLHQPIKPTVIGYYRSPFESLDDIIIKIDGTQMKQALTHIEEVHNAYDTNDIMNWEFLDDMTQRAYEEEVVFRNVMTSASVIALFIALLGMIGMISYNIIARTKEFGIRKVLGATFLQLLTVQGRAFIMYLALASLVAIPLSWKISSDWLATYAFRIDLTPIPFMFIILGLLVLTGLTIYLLGSSSFRQNPTKALRHE